MSSEDVDAFLAEADDVIEDWQGSADSAAWSADGSHEPDEIGGDSYFDDRPMRRVRVESGSTVHFAPQGGHVPPTVADLGSWSQIGYLASEPQLTSVPRYNVEVLVRDHTGALVTTMRLAEAAIDIARESGVDLEDLSEPGSLRFRSTAATQSLVIATSNPIRFEYP